jgi:hypothetical protein
VALKHHLRKKGHLWVSISGEPELYRWTISQRGLWKRGLLDSTLERKLLAIGFPFDIESCEWEQSFSRVAYCRWRYGCLPLPASQSTRWLEQQRELRKAGALSGSREERLAAVGAFDPPRRRPRRSMPR